MTSAREGGCHFSMPRIIARKIPTSVPLPVTDVGISYIIYQPSDIFNDSTHSVQWQYR